MSQAREERKGSGLEATFTGDALSKALLLRVFLCGWNDVTFKIKFSLEVFLREQFDMHCLRNSAVQGW